MRLTVYQSQLSKRCRTRAFTAVHEGFCWVERWGDVSSDDEDGKDDMQFAYSNPLTRSPGRSEDRRGTFGLAGAQGAVCKRPILHRATTLHDVKPDVGQQDLGAGAPAESQHSAQALHGPLRSRRRESCRFWCK